MNGILNGRILFNHGQSRSRGCWGSMKQNFRNTTRTNSVGPHRDRAHSISTTGWVNFMVFGMGTAEMPRKPSQPRTHEWIDQRSLALHGAVAEKLSKEPE